ncbi:MAG: hypothetical protein VW518_00465 [Burkholderiaceae bacterium]
MKIEAPTTCPSCFSSLVWKNDQLFCLNAQCGGQATQRIEHFAKTLKIKGLGPATISKLDIQNIQEIYQLSEQDLIDMLDSEKLGKKLYTEIQQSKGCDLQQILPAFSIPLIGKTAAERLRKVISSVTEINEETCKEAGLGPKATENLVNWYNADYKNTYKFLPFSFKQSVKSEDKVTGKGVVCITGKLSTVSTKAVAENLLKTAGYSIKSSITKDVTILLNESGIESAKTRKARDMGISVITNLNQLIEV